MNQNKSYQLAIAVQLMLRHFDKHDSKALQAVVEFEALGPQVRALVAEVLKVERPWDGSPPPLSPERMKHITREELHRERRVVWNLINELMAAGYRIQAVDDGEEQVKVKNDSVLVLDAVFAVDEARIHVQDSDGKHVGGIYIVLGNSAEEVICDWSWRETPGGQKFTAFIEAFEPEKYLR